MSNLLLSSCKSLIFHLTITELEQLDFSPSPSPKNNHGVSLC